MVTLKVGTPGLDAQGIIQALRTIGHEKLSNDDYYSWIVAEVVGLLDATPEHRMEFTSSKGRLVFQLFPTDSKVTVQ
jgi:hypothetical protein